VVFIISLIASVASNPLKPLLYASTIHKQDDTKGTHVASIDIAAPSLLSFAARALRHVASTARSPCSFVSESKA
jgi:hypothetical protein